jgi:uncharacterized protein YcbK (DUF882 family)
VNLVNNVPSSFTNQKISIWPALVICLILLVAGSSVLAQSESDPFFLMGDGRLHIKNMHTKKEARVNLLRPDGSINESALEQIDAVFGFVPLEKGEHISLRLLFMLNYFSNQVAPGQTIFMTSGYRSPEYNDGLRKAGGIVAKNSTHMDGLALDFYIKGVKSKELWEIIRKKNCGGVGHYGDKEIHLDAGRPRFWESATAKTKTNESDYNRRMYLSSDFDRYEPGRKVRLSLSSVSDFGFGIRPQAFLRSAPENQGTALTLELQNGNSVDCLPVKDRRDSRFIITALPKDLKPGRYRIRMDFCQRPFEQMPETILSNEIEILPLR